MYPAKVERPATLRVDPIEAVPERVDAPNTLRVPEADTFPAESTLKRPAKSVVEVARYILSERKEEVVEPFVTVT